MSINDIVQYFGIITGLILVILAWRSKPHEVKNLDSDSDEKSANAQKIIYELYDKSVTQVAQLQSEMRIQKLEFDERLRLVENPKEYEIIVRFKTTLPPEIGETRIQPAPSQNLSESPTQPLVPIRKKLFPFDKDK